MLICPPSPWINTIKGIGFGRTVTSECCTKKIRRCDGGTSIKKVCDLMYAESPAKPTLINYLSYSDRKIKGRRRHYTMYFDELLFIVQGGDAAAHSPNKTNASDSYNRRKYRVLSDTPEEEFLPQQLQRQCLFALCSTHHGNGNMVFRCWGRAVNLPSLFLQAAKPVKSTSELAWLIYTCAFYWPAPLVPRNRKFLWQRRLYCRPCEGA